MASSGGVGGRYMAYSPSPSAPHSPHPSSLRSASSALLDQEKYLSELLAERHKLSPFMPVLPITYRLLNQEIMRVTTLLGNASVLGQSGLEHASPLASGGIFSNGGADMNGLASRFQSEISGLMQPSSTQNWLSSQSSSSGLIVKRAIRVDIPIDKYPNYNFVGRLLGPRGNSLKRVEASTECRVLIRGRGSIKDPGRVMLKIKNCEKLQYTSLVDHIEDTSSGSSSAMHLENINTSSISLLEKFSISHCSSLTCIFSKGQFPASLKHLGIEYCSELTILSPGGWLPEVLEELSIKECPELESIAETFLNNTSLKLIRFCSCKNLKSLPTGLHNLIHLSHFSIIDCPSLPGLRFGLDTLNFLGFYRHDWFILLMSL